jgi:bifunctional DNase/RNase
MIRKLCRFRYAALAGCLSVFILWAQGAAAPPSAADGLRGVRVKSVIMDSRTSQPVVLLEDKKGGGLLPIWIGPAEAQAILLQLKGITPPRPMTHDLLKNVIGGLKAKVVRVVITELRGGTFYARIQMKSPGRSFSIDSRPSDAIALALRAGAPIFAEAKVLKEGMLGASAIGLTHQKRLGIVLQSMTPMLAKYFGGGAAEGLLVSQVREGEPGEKAGLLRGDVIFQAGGKTVSSVGSFERAFAKSAGGMSVLVRRGPSGENVQLRLVSGEARRAGKTK